MNQKTSALAISYLAWYSGSSHLFIPETITNQKTKQRTHHFIHYPLC